MRIMFGNEEISVANHEFLKESQFENMIDAVEAMQILDYYSIEKLLYLEDKYGLETEDMVNIIGYSLGVESLNIPINVYNYELINELGSGLEGLPTDVIKMGWRATKGTVKAVHKAHKTVYKGAKQLSSKWNTNIKPLIMKFLKEFQSQLQIMWGKFRKYDKLYTKLGKEINSVTQVYGKQMNSMRAVSIFYHKFNPNALKGYAEAIKDYDAFMGAITGSTELFGGKFVPPKEFANYLRSKNIAKAKECVDSMSAGMSKLNSRGDLAFAYAIINDSDKNISKSNFRKIRECFTGPEPEQILKAAIKNKSPLVEFVQVSILRKEIEGKYNEKDVNKFKNDMLGNAGFLTIMSSILNNQIIEKVLNGGGKSIKEQTREDMSAMEEIVRSGVSEQQNTTTKSNQVDAEKEEKARQSAEVTGNNGNTKGTTLEQEVKNAEGNTKTMQNGNQSEEFNPFGYQVGTEGLFDTITGYFKKSSVSQKSESKRNSLVTSLTVTEYKKAVEKFFLEHKKILENMLKPYSNAMKKYQVSINVPKYIEYDEIQDDTGGKLYIDFSKALNYADDYNDVDGEEIAKIIGIHPDGTDKFGPIIKKAFKDKFDFDLELDGDTDLVAFYTPDLNSITFKVGEGTEGLFDFFKSKPKENTITQSELDDILAELIKIEKKIVKNTLTEWQKKISSNHIEIMGLELLLNDPYCQSIPKGSSSSRIEVSHFSWNTGYRNEPSFSDAYDKMYDILKNIAEKTIPESIKVNGRIFPITYDIDDYIMITTKEKYSIDNSNAGNESYDNYFSSFFDQSAFTDGTEAGLAEAMGYDADNKQKAEAKAASTDKISSDPNSGEMGLAELADAYIQSYSILMSKATAAYSSMVKGFLAATFVLCKEADIIVKEIYSSTGANRNATNEAVNQDRPEQDDFDNEE